jgi:hypothetical protein
MAKSSRRRLATRNELALKLFNADLAPAGWGMIVQGTPTRVTGLNPTAKWDKMSMGVSMKICPVEV